MRIATWNVEYADKDATNRRRRAAMSAVGADVWVLTETHDDLNPGDEYEPCHGAQRPLYGIRVKEKSRWVSIWSRHPIREIEGPSQNSERTVAALINTPKAQLIVYGTVLPWHADRGRMGLKTEAKNWSEHHRVIPEQVEEWRDLKNRYPSAVLCVAGDYNTDMGSGRIYGTKRGIKMLDEAFVELDLVCATAPNLMPAGMLARPPIDHIAISRRTGSTIKVVGAFEGRVGSPRLSDHSAVVVEIF